jgi:hypothetical protein
MLVALALGYWAGGVSPATGAPRATWHDSLLSSR